jgi:hypothetical protein
MNGAVRALLTALKEENMYTTKPHGPALGASLLSATLVACAARDAAFCRAAPGPLAGARSASAAERKALHK